MPSITPMMSLILLLLALMSCMVDTTRDTTSPPRAATAAADVAIWLAVCAESEVCLTVLVSSSMLLAVVCRLLAVSSVRWARSLLPWAISPDAVAMLSVADRTSVTSLRSEVTMWARPSSIEPGWEVGICASRFPSATSCMMAMASVGSPPIWRSTERDTIRPMAPTTRNTTTTSARLDHRAFCSRASTSSVYRPEPTIQFHPSTRTMYCSLGTAVVWPGRANMVGTNALPSLLLRMPFTSRPMMSTPDPSLTLPSMSCPSHSGLKGCITPTPSVVQI